MYLLGNQGLLKGLTGGATIYGFWGIVVGEAFYTFPHALMILLTGLAWPMAGSTTPPAPWAPDTGAPS